MDFITHIREAFTNLFSSKLRSFLAILGVLVGTGSVVALISSSQLATSHALEQFKSLGTNLLAMDIEAPQPGGPVVTQTKKDITWADLPKISQASPQIVEAAAYINVFQPIIFKGQQLGWQVMATTEELAEIVKIEMEKGRFVSYLDKENYYCIVGVNLAKKMSEAGGDPIGQQLRIGNYFFTVIGVAKPWQPNFFLYFELNDGVVVPLQSAYLMQKEATISNILFRLIQNPNINLVQQQLTTVMKQLLPNKNIRFRNPQQIIDIVGKQRSTFTWLLAAIGGISLLVGGIGVMNIMLVSVVERRREIGVRMAIGARRNDILIMFLIEAIILTTFGGLIGIIVGVLISFILAWITGWVFYFFILPPVLGFVVSVLVGIISGYYPAIRASRLDPIKTLQSE